MNENAKRWLKFAKEDLEVAETILGAEYYNQTCFHSQQSVEKVIKAIISEMGKTPPRTHSITDLLSLIPSSWFSEYRQELVKFDDFYIPTRYPDALPGTLPYGLPGKKEAEKALDLAQKAFQESLGKL